MTDFFAGVMRAADDYGAVPLPPWDGRGEDAMPTAADGDVAAEEMASASAAAETSVAATEGGVPRDAAAAVAAAAAAAALLAILEARGKL